MVVLLVRLADLVVAVKPGFRDAEVLLEGHAFKFVAGLLCRFSISSVIMLFVSTPNLTIFYSMRIFIW